MSLTFNILKSNLYREKKKRGGCLEQRTTTTQTRKGERREKKAEKQITRVLQLISTHTHIHTHTQTKPLASSGLKTKGTMMAFERNRRKKKKLSTHRVSEGRKKKLASCIILCCFNFNNRPAFVRQACFDTAE